MNKKIQQLNKIQKSKNKHKKTLIKSFSSKKRFIYLETIRKTAQNFTFSFACCEACGTIKGEMRSDDNKVSRVPNEKTVARLRTCKRSQLD